MADKDLYSGLDQLGQQIGAPSSPDEAKLEKVPNPHPDTLYLARFVAPEFTSLCPVTGQPDFATLVIRYLGRPITRGSLLAYLVSFRNHQAFHEATVEQIYMDIYAASEPDQLSIAGRFLRRGGIDINPFRSNVDDQMPLIRLPRQ